MGNKRITTRENIIQAAIEVFSKKGFQAASISEIAEKVSIANGTMYRYFKSKEDLFFAIPIEKTKEFRSQVELQLEGIPDALTKIRKFVWYFLYFFKVNPDYGKLLMLEMRVNKTFVKTETYKFLKRSIGSVMDIIVEGQKKGAIRKDIDIYIMRSLVLGILEHMVTRWLLKDAKYDILEHHQEVSQILIDALKVNFPAVS